LVGHCFVRALSARLRNDHATVNSLFVNAVNKQFKPRGEAAAEAAAAGEANERFVTCTSHEFKLQKNQHELSMLICCFFALRSDSVCFETRWRSIATLLAVRLNRKTNLALSERFFFKQLSHALLDVLLVCAMSSGQYYEAQALSIAGTLLCSQVAQVEVTAAPFSVEEGGDKGASVLAAGAVDNPEAAAAKRLELINAARNKRRQRSQVMQKGGGGGGGKSSAPASPPRSPSPPPAVDSQPAVKPEEAKEVDDEEDRPIVPRRPPAVVKREEDASPSRGRQLLFAHVPTASIMPLHRPVPPPATLAVAPAPAVPISSSQEVAALEASQQSTLAAAASGSQQQQLASSSDAMQDVALPEANGAAVEEASPRVKTEVKLEGAAAAPGGAAPRSSAMFVDFTDDEVEFVK
jgi:hypothetical protein